MHVRHRLGMTKSIASLRVMRLPAPHLTRLRSLFARVTIERPSSFQQLALRVAEYKAVCDVTFEMRNRPIRPVKLRDSRSAGLLTIFSREHALNPRKNVTQIRNVNLTLDINLMPQKPEINTDLSSPLINSPFQLYVHTSIRVGTRFAR